VVTKQPCRPFLPEFFPIYLKIYLKIAKNATQTLLNLGLG
jgi:hypothetical protein